MQAEFSEGLPPKVRAVPEWVADPQFFPGASGLLTQDDWRDVTPGQSGLYETLPPPPTNGVMVVGNYFTSCATYAQVRAGESQA